MFDTSNKGHVSSLRADVENFLSQFRGTSVLLIPNPGNAGDCLILQGTLDAFERARVNVTIVDRSCDVRDAVVFIGGGGNLIDIYRDMRLAIEACRGVATKIVVLPHTIRGNADLIKSLDERVTLWCRDARSLEHVRSLNSRVESLPGHDMALHCNVRVVLENAELREEGWPILQTALERAGTSLVSLAQRQVVRLMRTDKEALHSSVVTDLDISRAFGSVADERSSAVTTWCFLRVVSQSQRIVTDRLHVGIAAALLGTPCELHDNSYNKNRLVYEHSLRGFPSLSFVPTGGCLIADQPVSRRASFFGKAQNHARQLYKNLARPHGAAP